MAYYSVQPLPDTNARQAAITVRPASTSLLAIDSEDRFSNYIQAAAAALQDPATLNASPYNFAITKSESLMNGFFTRVGVSEINIPWGIPNVNEKTNTVVLNYSGSSVGSLTITLLNGFYTPFNLALSIKNQIQAVPALAAVTFTYGNLDEPSFFYNSNNPALLLAWAPVPYSTATYRFPNTTKQLFNVLGMTGLNAIPSAVGASGYTFCQFTRYIDIVCTQLTNNQALKDQTSQTVARDVLARVYIGDALIPGNTEPNASGPDFTPPGCAPCTIYRQYANPKQIQWLPNQPIPGYLQFTVYDDAGAPLTEVFEAGVPTTPVSNPGYLDWSMTMMVSEN